VPIIECKTFDPPELAAKASSVKKNRLGSTQLEVTEIGFGCWALDGSANWGPQDERDSIAAIHAALDSGITFFDTAEAYSKGKSEQALAKGLGVRRDEVFIATKVSPGHLEPAALREACERSLKHLNTDRIDLYQIHWPARDFSVPDAIGTFETLRSEGKIRSYGVSNFGPNQIEEYRSVGGMLSTNQVAYSLVFRAIEHALLPATIDAGMGILAYSPIMQGLLGGRVRSIDDVPEGRQRTRHYSSTHGNARHGEEGHEALTFQTIERIRAICEEINRPMSEVAVRWLLDRGQVTSVLVGARNADQARRNAKAGANPLSADVVAALDAASEELKAAMGPNPDLWNKETRIN
jgi:myo-inositol catabolism protein IolS